MTRVKPVAKNLRHLGKPSRLPASPQAAVLDRVANPHPDTDYVARFTAPEFTTLCPITGQPDFAHFVIDYVPAKWLLESKSFKLYLGSFRDAGGAYGQHLRRPRRIEASDREDGDGRRPGNLCKPLAADLGTIAGLAGRLEGRAGDGVVDNGRINGLGLGHGVERHA